MRIILGKGQIHGPISGADETLVTYAEQILKSGHEVLVLLMYPPAHDDQYVDRLNKLKVPVLCVSSSIVTNSLDRGRSVGRKLLNLFPASKQLIRNGSLPIVTGLASHHYQRCREIIKQQKADLLHIITPDPSAMIMIQAGHEVGIPVIYHELGLPFHPPDFAIYYRQFTSVLPLCTEVAALSPKLLERCREELPADTSFSILPLMSEDTTNGNLGAERNGHVSFGFASRIEELKGPLVLMRAFGTTHQQAPNVRLKFAGAGSQREKVETLARSLNVAQEYEYSGVYVRADEGAHFMHDLDVFVMPSFSEGTPLCIIEAMANAKPIIASDVGGIPDMIDSESGILVPPGDARALASAMLELAKDPERRVRMGKVARERYLKLFSAEAVVPLMLDTYARLGKSAANRSSHPWRVEGGS